MNSLAIFVTLFAFVSLMPKKYLIETEDYVEAKEVKFAVISIILISTALNIKNPLKKLMKNRAIDCRNGASCIRTPGKHDVRCKGAGCKISWKPDGQNIECSGGAAHCAHGGTAGLGYHIYICTIVNLLLSHSSFLLKKFFSL